MNEQDVLRRFIFEELGVRGEWLRLEHSWQSAKQHQQGNAHAHALLGQALVAAVLLSATVKFKGSLIIQAQGQGPLTTLVAQATHAKTLRGLVRCQEEVPQGSLEQVFGEGYLVITIESENAEPYQGIAPLLGENFAEAIQTYFDQSEQLPTRIWLFANEQHAVGLFLQQLPGSESDQQEDWERVCMLANTITATELFTLSAEEVLYRLFNEDQVRIFDAEPVSFACNCSNQKIENTLFSLGRAELESILKEQELVEVVCEFCSHRYSFDRIDVERILMTGLTSNDTRH